MSVVRILILILCPILWRLGGDKHFSSKYRDIIIPIILGAYIGWITVWWLGLISVGTFNIIRLGYGIGDQTDEGSLLYRTLNKIKLGIPWVVRGSAGAIYGLWGLLPYVIHTHKIDVYLYYAVINFVLNAVGEKMKWKDYIVEPLAGLGIGSIVILTLN